MFNIKSDSRRIKKGDTFVAIKGILHDGHDFIEKAIELGASKIVAEHGQYSVETIIVDDTKKYLEEYLINNYYPIIEDMELIGVTGTNGKTTCCFLVHSILNHIGDKTAYIGTLGYYIGDKISSAVNTTPDICLLYEFLVDAKEKGCKKVVVEVSSEGIASGRVEGLKFDYAAFTNLTQDHLDYHKTMENYAIAKQMLFKRLRNSKKAIVNIDDSYKDYFLLPENNNITFGLNESKYQLVDVKPGLVTEFTYKHDGELLKSSTRLMGEYNLYNLLLVIALMSEMGYKNVNELVKEIPAPPGRMQYVPYNKGTILIDFAHTPDAFIKILEIVKPVIIGKLYAVFGSGGDRDRIKRPIMGEIMTTGCDYVIFTNEDPRTEDENQVLNDLASGALQNNYTIINDRVKAVQTGIDMLTENDCLMVLGKGHEECIIFKDYRMPYNDEKTILEYLNRD